MSYYISYLESISNGLKLTEYYINSNSIDGVKFFDEINLTLFDVQNLGGRVFFLGNGASAAFANHMALDFSKNGKICARSLSDSAMLTAISNDYSFETAFVEFLKIENVGLNDLVISISSSGNSANIVNALKFCQAKNIRTLGLSGLRKNNRSIELSKYSIYIPMKTYGMVECLHQIFLHLILDQFMKIYEWDREEFQNMRSNYFRL